jgi:hypothetical protein
MNGIHPIKASGSIYGSSATIVLGGNISVSGSSMLNPLCFTLDVRLIWRALTCVGTITTSGVVTVNNAMNILPI